MKAPIKLSILNPCQEAWSDMKTTDNGRFCRQCQKTVIDFTKMSDAEILQFFAKQKGVMMGIVVYTRPTLGSRIKFLFRKKKARKYDDEMEE